MNLRVKRKMIFIALCLLVLTLFLGFLLKNNKVHAGTTTPVCVACGNNSNMEYTSATSSGHTYTCKVHGQTVTANHGGASHSNGGKCKACGYKYQSHTMNATDYRANTTGTGRSCGYIYMFLFRM